MIIFENKFYILFILFFVSQNFINNIYSKILIITSAYNRSDFIEIQYKTFKKFLKDEYNFVVFCDAKERHLVKDINNTCKKLDITCINVPQEIHERPYLERLPGERFKKQSPAVRHCNVIQYALDKIGFQHDDIVVILDSDMFLVRDFSVRKYLDGCHVSSWLKLCCEQPSKCKKNHPEIPGFYYMWIGLVFLDMRTMPNKKALNFNCGLIKEPYNISVDSGGYTYHYLKNNKIKGKFFDIKDLGNLACDICKYGKRPLPPCTHNKAMLLTEGFDFNQILLIQSTPLSGPLLGRNIQFFLSNSFLHYQGGSNTRFSDHQQKTKALERYFEGILSIKD